MGKIMILNGSPRAPKSNSRHYAEIFSRYCPLETAYYEITRNNHKSICTAMADYSQVVLVFPLYADALPSGFLDFLKTLELNPPLRKPKLSVLINCGFLEYRQNEVAVKMLRLFARRNGYHTGPILMLGSGEAILKTPFKYVAVRNIRKFVRLVVNGDDRTICATMPITKRLFQMAATIYWARYGKRYGITRQQMETMKIEGE